MGQTYKSYPPPDTKEPIPAPAPAPAPASAPTVVPDSATTETITDLRDSNSATVKTEAKPATKSSVKRKPVVEKTNEVEKS